MAYSANDNLVQVEGSLPDGEVWSNSWAVKATPGTTDFDDVEAAFHDFYDTLATGAAPVFGNLWTATKYTRRHPSDSTVFQPSWVTITGTNANDFLPSECAVRVSLDDGATHNGGPFLAGFTVDAVTATGLFKLAYQNVVADAVEQLGIDLNATAADLALHRPTVPSVVEVTTAKVGQVFDVIRRRRNDLPEAYVVKAL